jgi:Fur family transcriptional regulator, ferric uptake regulator
MKKNYNRIKNILSQNGYKLTSQRKLVYDIFINHKNKYLCASEVYDYARKKSSSAGLTTIYRTIDILLSVGIIQKMPIEADESYYILASKGHKHHIVCVNCRQVCEIDTCMIDQMSESITTDTGFSITGHKLIVYGVCAKCKVLS